MKLLAHTFMKAQNKHGAFTPGMSVLNNAFVVNKPGYIRKITIYKNLDPKRRPKKCCPWAIDSVHPPTHGHKITLTCC